MNIGYACLALGVEDTSMKRCLIKKADEEILSGLIINNLESLKNLINYNIKNGIKLFRISSDLIPFGSSPINKIQWWDENALQLQEISLKIQASGMRISMHPGQYTVLNSNNEDVVERTIKDLEYHAKVLDCLTTNYKHKIILHIGGVYNDKNKAIDRFIRNYKGLPMEVKRRLVIENDDKSYNISDVLSIGKILNIPVVFDNLHHEINPPELELYIEEWIDLAKKTWHKKDGVQKIHYSQQNNQKKGVHIQRQLKFKSLYSFINLLHEKI